MVADVNFHFLFFLKFDRIVRQAEVDDEVADFVEFFVRF